MINNKLTSKEFEKILVPIIRLDDIKIIKSNIYEVLHFTKVTPNDKSQYRICAETTGINSTYKAFEIEVRRLEDRKNDYSGVIIQFRKKKAFIDYFINRKRQMVNELKRLCHQEINEAWFSNFDPGGKAPAYVEEEFLYQLGAINPEWKEQNKLSPLTIFTKEDSRSYLVEFLFSPECYERKSNKSVLRKDWLEIFSLYTSSW